MLEPDEIAGWRRLTESMIGRAGRDDPEAFAQVVHMIDHTQYMLELAAYRLHYGQSVALETAPESVQYSWAEIGRALGVTKQSVWRRFANVSRWARAKS